MNITLISPELGLGKGGIQTWAYYIDKLFKENHTNIKSFALRNLNVKLFFQIISSYFTSNIFILMTWKMAIAIFPIIIFTNKKVFIFIHGNDILNLSPLQKKMFIYLIKKNNIKIIANSIAISNIFSEYFNKNIDNVFYPFMDTLSHYPNNQKIHNQFFTVTRLVKRKNIDNVIKALKILKDEGFNFKYYIAGSGEEENYIKDLIIKLGLETSIIFLGRISEEEKNKFLATSSLFLLPSIYDEINGSIEGYGMVYIEANAYATPVISGNSGGIVEAVKNDITGFHTDGSVEDIYQKIKKFENFNFDGNEMVSFANEHLYSNQKFFLDYILKG